MTNCNESYEISGNVSVMFKEIKLCVLVLFFLYRSTIIIQNLCSFGQPTVNTVTSKES